MKLHLGCGQKYLEGYVNIDFSLNSHTVQESSIADIRCDILDLNYPAESIKEIRLHHLFEHFPRPVACALLASWYSWLRPGGVIHIEVPDFEKTARTVLNHFTSFEEKAVAERHLFGTHEAGWAVHCEGYTPKLLQSFIEKFGFRTIKIKKNNWKGTHNFELIAKKIKLDIQKHTKEGFKVITENFLKGFLLDNSESEYKLLSVWLNIFDNQIEKTWAS